MTEIFIFIAFITIQINIWNFDYLQEHQNKALSSPLYTNSRKLGFQSRQVLNLLFLKVYFLEIHFPIAAPIIPPAMAEPPTTVAAARNLPGR